MSEVPEPGPLHGIRVADFGHKIAGPLTAVMLADQGADVVHIDAPGAAAADEPADAFFSRGKRRITLDLKQPADLATARALIERSDVLIENFRPGVMSRRGLGYTELSAASPRLVYCSLPGFGATDPRAGLPGWEGVIDAATGNCRIRAGEAPERWDTSWPTYSSVPGASTAAAFLAAVAVVSALVERHKSGRGQHIEVPLFDAVFEVIGDAGTYVTARGLSPQLPLAKYGSGTYQCRDGRYVQFNPIGATSRFVSWFLRAGIPVQDTCGLDRPLSPRHQPDADREQVLAELATGGPRAATPQAGQAPRAGREYETQGQAVTGIMARGGDDGRPAVLGPYNFLDYGTYYQARYLLDYPGKTWTEPAGPGALGEGPLQRFYRASDGWFFLGVTEADLIRLSGVPGLEFAAEVSTGEASRGADQEERREELGKLLEERVRDRQMSVSQLSPEAGDVTMPGLAIKMSATPPSLGAAAHQPGADVREVLELAGLAGPLQSLSELEQRWAVQATRLPAGWETSTETTHNPKGSRNESS